MDAETIFSICNLFVLPGWALLIFLPRWKYTVGVICAGIIPFVLGLVYLGLFLSQGFGDEGGGFGSVEGVMTLFQNPYILTAGWVHYLAFDLFVGSWEVRDSQQIGLPHWFVLPCLPLTFMLGPIGLVAYMIIRTIKVKSLTLYTPESAAS